MCSLLELYFGERKWCDTNRQQTHAYSVNTSWMLYIEIRYRNHIFFVFFSFPLSFSHLVVGFSIQYVRRCFQQHVRFGIFVFKFHLLDIDIVSSDKTLLLRALRHKHIELRNKCKRWNEYEQRSTLFEWLELVKSFLAHRSLLPLSPIPIHSIYIEYIGKNLNRPKIKRAKKKSKPTPKTNEN